MVDELEKCLLQRKLLFEEEDQEIDNYKSKR